MKITELINILNEYKEEHGEIEVILCDEFTRYSLTKQNIYLNEYSNNDELIILTKD